jgi:beta-glucosidase
MPVRTQEAIAARVEELLSQLTLREKISLLAGKDTWKTVPIPRLGIPSITMTDGPHGVRSSMQESGRKAGPTTCFPTGVSFASTWNTALIEKVGGALAEETRGMDCEILLGPCVNIVRHPLAGRNFEAYAEDPYLAGKIGAAWVKGLQDKKVGASLKHYACNNQEIERGRGSTNLDERTLREIYLPHFETVVKEAQPWTVMCSYNRVNGVYASENKHLLREILKEEWGFQGFVVSDWGANHTIVESVKNGLDLEMPGPAKYYGQLLEDSINNWQLDEKSVEEAVRRILRIVVLSGKMDGEQPAGSVNTPQHQDLAREVAEEAIVLLKNEGTLLPLKVDQLKTIAVIGPNAAEDRIGGGGSSFVDPPYRVSPLEALQARLGDKVAYEKGCDNFTEPPALGPDMLKTLTPDGHVLKVEIFNNPDLTGASAGEMYTYKAENWLWVGSLEFAGVTQPHFSLRASGTILPRESGLFTFTFTNTASCQLYLDDALVLEHESDPAHATSTLKDSAGYTCQLTAGVEIPLRVEYRKANDENFAFLRLALATALAPEEDDRITRAAALAARSDVALVFAGMPEGFESEGHDRPDMHLPGRQVELIQAVAKANPKTVVILNAGSPVEMPWLDLVPAVLEAYYPGQEGGNAVARVLMGEVNPSGKLSETFPVRLEDTPAYINYPGTRDVNYGEGIFVGYRYYEKKDIQPLFSFGHGLSYTQFEYANLELPATGKAGDCISVSLTVRNSGGTAGKEVVQVYVRDLVSSLVRPLKELKAFAKVDLRSGEETRVNFVLDPRAFAFFDPYRNAWIVEPGEFEILVGSSSKDLRLSGRICLD